ncbi:hypothetical protein BCR34DRAFT_624793 [Clohesyomyces aquaticus]|uniref:Geranylgeranyl pyrophosphate synthetase n=1 Tax=Clohesyomyces aquaticus TaxID=1231657 RepID=A0A1Y1ZMS1_9PLEO|nr:hypothetical protein BCR34DRAFT_624793 [Clohesyomyces aquaticus]
MAANNTIIASISRPDLLALPTPASASITHVQHLASYNWLDSPRSKPTIAIPGSPDLWTPPTASFTLKPDSGRFYIAQNAARHPDSPLEPLFRALYIEQPEFDVTGVDVVTDRNNLRKLLGFVNKRWSRGGREDFTMHVEVRGKTAILQRQESKTMEFIPKGQIRGYGHGFERKCMESRVKGSTGHHRIIGYRFGGLDFVVRHETDGYVGDNLSSVLDALSLSNSISKAEESHPASRNSKLFLQKAGQAIPLSSTLEVKTRVAHKPLPFKNVVSQLWVSQTPNLVRAYHANGAFAVPVVENMTDQVKAWEEQNQDDLGMLAGLIGRIREVVREGGGRAVLKYDAKRDALMFEEVAGKMMLPGDLYGKWEGGRSEGESGGLDSEIAEKS